MTEPRVTTDDALTERRDHDATERRDPPGARADAGALPGRVGPYVVERELGRGGMGVVLRAAHERTGTPVALKIVRVPHPGLYASIRREIQSLSRLDHPGIVRIHDEGTHEGVPWYAMELLEGLPTLQQHMRRVAGAQATSPGEAASSVRTPLEHRESDEGAGAGAPSAAPLPERLAAAVTIVRRLCVPLAYMHGEGLVHRDLKPGNVLVRPGGVPILVDFGLSVSFGGAEGRESFEVGGDAAGTLAYMSPEQARGDLVDARSDLYALGCILYELVTGLPPFRGPNAPALARQASPLPLSAHVPGVSTQLEDLVARLLARTPQERFGYAADVALALDAVGAEDAGSGGAPAARTYLYRPRFAGRREAMEDLAGRLARLRERSGALALLKGESGAGKTRLAMELALRARRGGVDVLIAECEAGGGALHPFRRILQGLADRCRTEGAGTSERLLGRRGKLLARYEPALRGLPGHERHPEPAELAPAAARLRLMTQLWETLAAIAADRPHLLVVDDAQWADELTLGLLEHMVRGRALEGSRLLVVATYRSEEESEELRRLATRDAVVTIPVPPLHEGAIAAIAQDMLALERCPPPLAAFLARTSEGNAFHASATLRLAVDRGLLRRDDGGRWHLRSAGDHEPDGWSSLGLPQGVRALVAAQLERLSPGARELAGLAAVVGREVDPELLQRAWDADVAAPLGELVARQLLDDLGAGGLRFHHDKVREVAYDAIPADGRAALHARVAAVIDALPEGERLRRLAVLAEHRERAGEADAARAAYLAAARHAAAGQALAEAERLYRRHLALLPEPTADGVRARIDLAEDVLAARGALRESVEEAWTAYGEARALGERALEARAAHFLGVIQLRAGRNAEARLLYGETLAIHRELRDRAGEGRVLGSLGTLEREVGRLAEAAEILDAALAIHREAGNRAGEGVVLGNRALVTQYQGSLEAALAQSSEALRIHRETGNRAAEANVMVNQAQMLGEAGRIEEECALYAQALAIHRDLGHRRGEIATLGNLAVALQQLGRLDESLPHYASAAAIARELGERKLEGPLLGNLASAHWALGRIDEARAQLAAALAIAVETSDARVEAWLIGNLLQSGAYLAEPPTAGDGAAQLARAEAIFEEMGDRAQLLELVARAGHVRLARGESAAAELRRAREIGLGLEEGVREAAAGSLGKLARAQDAFERGLPLACGHLLEDMTDGERRWIRERLRDATPAELLARIAEDGTLQGPGER